MNIYKDIIVLISATLVMVFFIVFGLSYAIDIKPPLLPQEKRFARFSYKKVNVVQRKPAALANVKSPLEVVEGRTKDFPSEALADIAPVVRDEKNKAEKEKSTTQKLSLILIKDHAKLAIVNGAVVREGDMTKSGKVQKITKEGIILKDSEGEKWLKIE